MYENLTTSEDEALWERLRSWRADTAKKAGVPPYVIFLDRTLLDVVLLKPENAADLAQAGGMGQAKIEKYGAELLAMLAEHYAAHGRGAPQPALPPEASGSAPVREPGDTAAKSLELFRELGSVAAVAERRGLKPSSVHGHLLAYVAWGRLSAEAVCGLPDEVLAQARETLTRLRREGAVGLTPAFDALGGAVPYEALRCLDAELRAKVRDGQG